MTLESRSQGSYTKITAKYIQFLLEQRCRKSDTPILRSIRLQGFTYLSVFTYVKLIREATSWLDNKEDLNCD
jgi:hypothetical protein